MFADLERPIARFSRARAQGETKSMWKALIARHLYTTRSVHYPGLGQGAACGAIAREPGFLLMSKAREHVTCRRCRGTWRFKLGR